MQMMMTDRPHICGCGCAGVRVWVCGCVGVWVCGCVGVWVWTCVGVDVRVWVFITKAFISSINDTSQVCGWVWVCGWGCR
jgi:hypothetical protein